MYVGRIRENWNHTSHLMANMAAVMTGQPQYPDSFNQFAKMFRPEPSDNEVSAALDFFEAATTTKSNNG